MVNRVDRIPFVDRPTVQPILHSRLPRFFLYRMAVASLREQTGILQYESQKWDLAGGSLPSIGRFGDR